MSTSPTSCPNCGSAEIALRPTLSDWICLACKHGWQPQPGPPPSRARLFLSYGRRDAEPLATRLETDLKALGYEVWRDTREIRSGKSWEVEIADGLRSTQLVVALLSPHAVRAAVDPTNPDRVDSVCLDELSFARFACKVPIVPVMAVRCDPPFVVFRLDYVDLCAWLDADERYRAGFERLQRAIEAGLRGEPPGYRRWDDRLRPIDFAPLLYDKRRDFCGRQWLFATIEAWRTANDRQRALLITGDPGIGKSAIVAQLIHLNPGGQVLAYHCCRSDEKETLRPGRFVRSLAAQVASQFDGYAAQLDDPRVADALSEVRCVEDPIGAFVEGLINPLHGQHAPPGGTRYLLIDALDEAIALGEGMTIVTLLEAGRLDRLPGWLRVVATTRNDPAVLDRLRGLHAEQFQADDPRNLDDIEQFLAQRLSLPSLSERWRRGGHSVENLIGRLRAQSRGNFLWAQQALLGLEHGLFDFDRLDALPPGLQGLYLHFFERAFPDTARFEPVQRLLQVVVAAGEPLTEDQIAAAAALDPENELPALLRVLNVYLPERDGRRALYHKSFADWLTHPDRRGTPFFISRRRGHERLADWCWAEYRQNPRAMSHYSLRHLPRHLFESSRWDDTITLLRDLTFLEAKAEAGLVFDLALDYTRAVERLPLPHPAWVELRLLRRALYYDLHFIARHPTALFQCFWNRCWWHDSPDAASHYDPPPGGWPPDGPPWEQPGTKIHRLLEQWRTEKTARSRGGYWVRSLRPPETSLDSRCLATFGLGSSVGSVTLSHDGAFLAASGESEVRLWESNTGRELGRLQVNLRIFWDRVRFSPDGRFVLFSCKDGVRVWDWANGDVGVLTDAGSRVAWSPDGQRLGVLRGKEGLQIWNWGTRELVAQAPLPHEGAGKSVGWDLAFLADCRRLLTTNASGRAVHLGDTGHSPFTLSSMECNTMGPSILAVSTCGTRFALTLRFKSVILRATGSPDTEPSEQHHYMRHSSEVTEMAFAPDGEQLLTVTGDGCAHIWNLENSCEVDSWEVVNGRASCLAVKGDGAVMATGGSDGMVRLWDLTRSRPSAQLHRGHRRTLPPFGYDTSGGETPNRIQLVGFSPDGRILYTIDEQESLAPFNQRILSWDAESGLETGSHRADEGEPEVYRGAPVGGIRAAREGAETVFRSISSERSIAYYPFPLDPEKPHPSLPLWAGTTGSHLHLVKVERFADRPTLHEAE